MKNQLVPSAFNINGAFVFTPFSLVRNDAEGLRTFFLLFLGLLDHFFQIAQLNR
jgi:hypothetical protein